MPAFMLARLDRETRDQHATASADRARAAAHLPEDGVGYRATLSRVWGFEAAVEGAVATTVGMAATYDLRSRHHMIALRADLMALGVSSPSQLPSCALALPGKGMDIPTALGFLYAIDRAALPVVPAGTTLPTRYLKMAHDLTALGAACDKVAKTPQIAGAIVAAAHSAFSQMHTWFGAAAGSSTQSTSARVARIARRAER
jgi:heme oxygenase